MSISYPDPDPNPDGISNEVEDIKENVLPPPLYAFMTPEQQAEADKWKGILPDDREFPIVEVVRKPRANSTAISYTSARKYMKITTAQWKGVREMYLAGATWTKIAFVTGLKLSTIKQRASLEGWIKTKNAIRDAKVEIITEAKRDLGQTMEVMGNLARNKLAQDTISTMERVDKYTVGDLDEEATREGVVSSLVKRSAVVFGWEEAQAPQAINVAVLNALPDLTYDEDLPGAVVDV